MFTVDIAMVPPSVASVEVIAQSNYGRQRIEEQEHNIGVCAVVNPGGVGRVQLSPLTFANSYLGSSAEKTDRTAASVEVIQIPKHGHVKLDLDGNWAYAEYVPDADYLGNDPLAIKKDFFAVRVNGNGYAVTIHYFMAITDDVGVKTNPDPICSWPWWKMPK